MIHSKEEIQKGLQENFQKIIDLMSHLTKEVFENTPNGKWSPGQQLDHLLKSVKPLNNVLLFPKVILKLYFGKMNRKPRNYDELLNRYYEKLSKGRTASSPFIPPVIVFEQRADKLKQYTEELNKLGKHLDDLTEEQLDTILLPHPLLGKLNLREMMMFTIFHTNHHLDTINKGFKDVQDKQD